MGPHGDLGDGEAWRIASRPGNAAGAPIRRTRGECAPPAAEGRGASLGQARANGAKEDLTRQERARYRDDVLEQTGGDWLKFQAQAVRRYGPAGGIMCREILSWDDKGDDPSGGWIYMTKWGLKQSCEYRTGLSPKS